MLSSIRNEVHRLRNLANTVNRGLNKLVVGGRQLEDGTQQLADAAGGLSEGLLRLSDGAQRLVVGLGELQGGAGQLESHLASGFQESQPLETGLRRAAVRVSATAGPLAEGARRLQRSSPHLFDSGYFVLSALEGASPRRQALAGEAVSVRGGGQAARMLVIPTTASTRPSRGRSASACKEDADRIGREGGLRTGVGGGAATVNDYGAVTRARIPLVVGAVVIACFLMLLLILRSPLLAAIAVVLNLASVGAAIGVMSLVCKIPDGYPLGGHPYIDTVGAAAIFGVTFGLSIDYAVFLLARMREHYLRGRRQRRGDRIRAGADRRGDHRRGGDHGRRLHLLRRRADRDREPDGGRPDRRDPARRDRRQDRPPACPDAALRRSRLAHPALARPAAAGAERPGLARSRRRDVPR